MRQFKAETTSEFFNTEFAKLERRLTSTPETKLRHRDHLFLRYLLEPVKATRPRILDFGCGQGRQLANLIKLGHDAVGMEPHEGMRTFAKQELNSIGASNERLLKGGVDEFCALPDQSFDIIVMMGVVQYLSDEDYVRVLRAVPRILRPAGFLAATFQNALFDLFTFNKYTVDFFAHELIGDLAENSEKEEIERAISALLTSPAMPPYEPSRARDNIFVRLTNPLLIDEQLSQYGLWLQSKYFYEWFGLPPLLATKLGQTSKRIANHFEVEKPTNWHGHFMANAFLAHIRTSAPTNG